MGSLYTGLRASRKLEEPGPEAEEHTSEVLPKKTFEGG